MKIAAALIGGLLVLSGCASIGPGFKTVSADDGGGRGQVRKSASEMADAMAGGLIGGALGGSLSAGDRRKALEAEYRALEYGQSGQAVAWSGRNSRSGTVVPAQPYRVGSQDCRQYSHTVVIDGASQSARGTACRNPDGSWTTLS